MLKTIQELESLDQSLNILSRNTPIPKKVLKSKMYQPAVITSKRIVWGFNTINFARSMGEKHILCHFTQDNGLFESLKLLLLIENRPGNYSWEEKLNILELMKAKMATALLPELSELIEGNNDRQWYGRIETYASFSKHLRILVNQGQLDFKTAQTVKTLPDRVFELTSKANLTFSQKRIILGFLKEISLRDNLNTEQTVDLFNSTLESGNPVDILKHLRYPKLTQLEKEFQSAFKKQLAGSGIKLSPPPYFEGSDFTVQFNFKDRKTLEKKINFLINLKGSLNEFLRLLY